MKKEKINWTKVWSKKYNILEKYKNEVNTKEYENELRKLLNKLMKENNYSYQDSMLVLKDILYHEYLNKKEEYENE